MEPSRPPLPHRLAVALSALSVLSAFVLLACAGPAVAFDAQSDQSAEATVAYDGDALALETAPRQVVAGDTTLSAGSQIVVRIEASGDRPFVLSRPVTVGSEGGFEIRFDLRARHPTANATVSILYDSRVLTSVPAEIRGVETTARSTASTTAAASTTRTRTSTAPATTPGSTEASLLGGASGVPAWFAGLLAVAVLTLAVVVVRDR